MKKCDGNVTSEIFIQRFGISNIIREAASNNENIVNRLSIYTALYNNTEGINQIDIEVYRQLKALNQTTNQENTEAASII